MQQSVVNDDEWKHVLNLFDDCLQDYLRDACRIFNVKVYQCDFFRDQADEKCFKTIYFTSRFELGHSSVYDKLDSIKDVLNAGS